MSRWFRHYAGMMRDDKLVRVAIRSGQTIERVVWVWGAILESASEINDEGRYDFDRAEAAYFLRAPEADVAAILSSLGDAGRVSGDHVVKWGDRQFKSDRSAERQARYRERKSGSDAQGEHEIPTGERNTDGRVTSPSRHRDAPETELETETETEVSEANASSECAPVIFEEKKRAIASCLRQAFPCPDGVSVEQWASFRSQRKKTLNPRSYLLLCNKLAALAEAGWPPGDMIDLAIERGWETVFEPRNQANGSNVTSLRGTRPDPALDLLRAARAAEDREADRGAGTSLPAIRSG